MSYDGPEYTPKKVYIFIFKSYRKHRASVS